MVTAVQEQSCGVGDVGAGLLQGSELGRGRVAAPPMHLVFPLLEPWPQSRELIFSLESSRNLVNVLQKQTPRLQ